MVTRLFTVIAFSYVKAGQYRGIFCEYGQSDLIVVL